MTTLLNWPSIPIPISTQWRKRCEQHAHNQIESIRAAEANEPNKAKTTEVSTYQQTLATLVIQYYLRMIDVPHRLETLPSGLTLYVEELGGYLTCCPLPPAAKKCLIPDHNKTEQKGYLFVELSAPYHQAQVLGFVPQVSVSELPISYLQPLSTFVEALEKAAEKASKNTAESISENTAEKPPTLLPRIPLSDWAQGLIAGWQHATTLPPAIQPAQAMRSSLQQHQAPTLAPLYERYAAAQGDVTLAKALAGLTPAAALTQIITTTTDDVIRWHAAEQLAQQNNTELQGPNFRVKSLVNDLGGLPIALLVGTVTKPDGTFLVGCRLYRLQTDQREQYALPENLVLQGVEERPVEERPVEERPVEERPVEERRMEKATTKEKNAEATGQVFCQLTPATHGDPLEYLFTAEAGDCFSLRIHYQGQSAVNTFVL